MQVVLIKIRYLEIIGETEVKRGEWGVLTVLLYSSTFQRACRDEEKKVGPVFPVLHSHHVVFDFSGNSIFKLETLFPEPAAAMAAPGGGAQPLL
jgi:hypothetical protein